MKTTMRFFFLAVLLVATGAPSVKAQGGFWSALGQSVKDGLPGVQIGPVGPGRRGPTAGADLSKMSRGVKSVLAVVNATGRAASGSLDQQIWVEVKVQQEVVALLPPGEDWKVHYRQPSGRYWAGMDYGYGYGYRSDTLIVTVSACTSVEEESHLVVPDAPWALEVGIAGPVRHQRGVAPRPTKTKTR